MNKPKRWALRAAARIRQSLANVHSSRPSLAFPETAWSQCTRLVRQIDKAAGRDWTLAARRLHRELVYSIGTCRRHRLGSLHAAFAGPVGATAKLLASLPPRRVAISQRHQDGTDSP